MNLILNGTLNAFYNDDKVVHICLKCLIELVQNSSHRLRSSVWNVNGLVTFKETGQYVIGLLKMWECLKSKSTSSDLYASKFKFVKEVSQWFCNIICGNYINFAMCEYYQDNTFAEVTELVLTTYTNLDY